jgi:Spy/CpxP family protein refolding chaperone
MRAGGFFRQLNLTEDQKAKIKQIRENFAQTNKPLREQLRAKRQELRQANEGGTFNEALATQKLTEIAPLEAKLMADRAKLHQEMLSVLTAEQKAQLEQSKAQFKTRRGRTAQSRQSVSVSPRFFGVRRLSALVKVVIAGRTPGSVKHDEDRS